MFASAGTCVTHRLPIQVFWLLPSSRASAPALPSIVFPTATVPLTVGSPGTAASQIPNLVLSVVRLPTRTLSLLPEAITMPLFVPAVASLR